MLSCRICNTTIRREAMFDKNLFVEMVEDHLVYHSNFQMDHFIVEKNGFTVYGMYKQSLRELYERFNELKRSMASLESLKLDIKEINSKHYDGQYVEHRRELDKAQMLCEARGLAKSIEHRIRELVRFYYQAASLKKKVGDLTPKKRDELEAELWYFRIKKQAAMEMIAHRTITTNTIENILALPLKYREDLFYKVLNEPVTLVDWIRSTGYKDHVLEKYEVKEVDVNYIRGLLYAANGIRDAVITRIEDTPLCKLLEGYEAGQ
jgi:hypothetical protein